MNEQNQLLLVRKQNTQAFMQVGGKLESNEPPGSCVIKRDFRNRPESEIKQFVAL